MATCQGYAQRYVGKGKDRTLIEGRCVLEVAHDGDCMPAQMAYKQMQDLAYNQAIDDVLALLGQDIQTPLAEVVALLRKAPHGP